MRKKLINFLHWTPFGLITVPLYQMSNDDVSLKWIALNGVVMGSYITIVIIYFTLQ